MDIQKEREAFERHKAKQLKIDYVSLKNVLDDCERRFPNNRYAGYSDFNRDFETWLAAKAQAVPEGKGRSDFEIIDQTIELVDLIASSNRFQRDKFKPFPFESNNPRNIEWWRLACKIQELLTDTDPDNCDFEEYKAMIEAQEPTND